MLVSTSQSESWSRELTTREMSSSAEPAGSASSVSFVTVTESVRSSSRCTIPRFAGDTVTLVVPSVAVDTSAGAVSTEDAVVRALADGASTGATTRPSATSVDAAAANMVRKSCIQGCPGDRPGPCTSV